MEIRTTGVVGECGRMLRPRQAAAASARRRITALLNWDMHAVKLNPSSGLRPPSPRYRREKALVCDVPRPAQRREGAAQRRVGGGSALQGRQPPVPIRRLGGIRGERAALL